MSKIVVSIDNSVIKQVQIVKDRTTLGRRPYNDVVIDNLAVSGEHAVLLRVGEEVYIEDLNSTNGTYINGRAIKKQLLTPDDVVEIGKYRVRYLVGAEAEADYGAPPSRLPRSVSSSAFMNSVPPQFTHAAASHQPALVKVLNGAAAGREVLLSKAVTTVGKPGLQVASLARRPGGYVLVHVEGAGRPHLNGKPIEDESAALKNGDVIELAGTQMQFVQG